MYTIKKPNLQAKLNDKKLILTNKKLYPKITIVHCAIKKLVLTNKNLYPKITIVYLNISEVSDYILSECYRRRCNHIILKLHNHFNAISLGCCFNVTDSRLSDSMYSFIRHLKRVQMLMVFHTCIHFICCYFALFFRVFSTKVVYILEVIFFSTRE